MEPIGRLIGRRIKAERRVRQWSQNDLARRAKVTDNTVSRWELGSTPRIDELLRVVKAYGMTVSELIGEEKPKPPSERHQKELELVERSVRALYFRTGYGKDHLWNALKSILEINIEREDDGGAPLLPKIVAALSSLISTASVTAGEIEAPLIQLAEYFI